MRGNRNHTLGPVEGEAGRAEAKPRVALSPVSTKAPSPRRSGPSGQASRGNSSGEFAVLLRRLLVIERVRPVREVATALGMTYSSFHARLHGRVAFRPEEITRVLRIVPDMRLLDCLLLDTGFLAVARPENAEMVDMRLAVGMTVRSAEAVLATLRTLHEALFTADLGRSWRGEVEQQILEAQRGLATLSLALPKFGPDSLSRRR